MKIKFSFRAKKEFIDSAKFYEGRVVGLAQDLNEKLETMQRLFKISQNQVN